VSLSLSFPFKYMCTHYFHHIHPITPFPHVLSSPIGTILPRQDLFCPPELCFFKGKIVGARGGTLTLWVGIWPYEKAPRNWGKGLRTRLCMCELSFGFVRKLKGNETKVSGPEFACVIWYLALWESPKELRQWSQTESDIQKKKQCSRFPRWLCVLQM
jgi:hypothetical protein